MKGTMRYAALLAVAVLVVALGCVDMIHPGVAIATNEDVEFLQPPTNKGDPDKPDTFTCVAGFRTWIRRQLGTGLALAGFRLPRQAAARPEGVEGVSRTMPARRGP